MFNLILRLLRWLRGGTLKLLIIAGIILLIWGIVSPVGTLLWWANQGAQILGITKNPVKELLSTKAKIAPTGTDVAKDDKINCYIVFLPGVGDFSGDELTPGEEDFLDSLVQSHPNCVAVRDVFPYSAANKSLGGQRLLAPVWRFANSADGWLGITNVLIKIRNLWRFAISADPRYGTVYNQGIATAIIERMDAIHPIPRTASQPLKIVLIGTSGGVEVSLGAASYLNQWLNAKIVIVSIGGVFDGRKGFDAIAHFYHLRGRRDWVEDIGGIVFPSRWLWNVTSAYSQARLRGHYTASFSGPHTHDGSEGYFGEELVDASGVTYVDLTVQQVNQLPIWSDDKR
jgi:hypothetical protein